MNSVMFAGLLAQPPAPPTTMLHGVQMRYGAVRAPNGSHDAIICHRTYQMDVAATATVLVVPGAFESAELYTPLAFWLAEHGLRVTLMNLGEHGSADWYSYDGGAVEALHLADYLRHVLLVLQQLETTGEPLILAGSGLGGVLAQWAALFSAQVAALALFGAPLPEAARARWRRPPLPRHWYRRWHSHPAPSAPAPIMPPSRHHLRGPWLPLTASDREVFAVWRLLGTETPHLAAEYARLVGQTRPAALPALVCVGVDDPFITPHTAWTTAQAYQTEPTIVPQAAHWLLAGPAWLSSARLLLAFSCQVALTPSRVAVTKGPPHA
jgi:alpha-beta hydrolase superfamily lysophospholipase